MTDTAAQSKINDWVSGTYGVTPTSGVAGGSAAGTSGTGMLSAAAAPAGTAPAAAAAAPASAVTPDVNSWYRSTLGRDGDAGGISFWQNALKTSGATPEQIYADFEKGAQTNAEHVNTSTSWADANAYKGPMSSDSSSVVDDWGKNVLGRNLTSAESSQWNTAMSGVKSADDANKVYQNFLTTMGSQVKNPLDISGASQIAASTNQTYAPQQIQPDQLALRTIDKPTETVAGQINSIVAADSPVMQQARAGAMTAANDRGLLNSSIATSGAEDAVIRAATGIGTSDAGFYNEAANYNAAAKNQATMYNTQAQNAFLQQSQSLDSQAQLQKDQLAATKGNQDAQLASQMSIAQLQQETTKWQTEANNAQSKYGTDASTQSTKMNLVNAIIQNMDMSPDRKAAMLEQLGEGTSAQPGKPGTGLAGAVYVIDSTSADLTPFGAFAQAAVQIQNGGKPTDEEKAAWAKGQTIPGDTNTPASMNWGPGSPGYG